MKVQVRQSVFETNSSSTHALCFVDKDKWYSWLDGAPNVFFNFHIGISNPNDFTKDYNDYVENCKSKGVEALDFTEWMCQYQEFFTAETQHHYYSCIDTEWEPVPGHSDIIAVSTYAE